MYCNHQKEQYRNGRNSKRHEPDKAGSPAEAAWGIKPQHQPQVTNRQGDRQRIRQNHDRQRVGHRQPVKEG